MSKSKEYYDKVCYESNLWDEKNAKKLAHKTLEDVEELLPNIHDPIYKMTTQPTIDNWKAYAVDCKLAIDKIKSLKI